MTTNIPSSDFKRLSRSESLALYQELTLLGSHYALNPFVSVSKLEEELGAFDKDWHPYNPNKPNYKRWGLSITSLDGKLSGLPDLTSLREHNVKFGTNYDEHSFTKLTPVYEACKSLHEFLDPFIPFLGRTHFLRFEAGGYFPYHRDAHGPTDIFRIFIPLHNHASRDFIFLLGPQRIELDRGQAYFINTMLEHALFTFDGPSLHLVANVRLCRESVDLVQAKLATY